MDEGWQSNLRFLHLDFRTSNLTTPPHQSRFARQLPLPLGPPAKSQISWGEGAGEGYRIASFTHQICNIILPICGRMISSPTTRPAFCASILKFQIVRFRYVGACARAPSPTEAKRKTPDKRAFFVLITQRQLQLLQLLPQLPLPQRGERGWKG